MIAAPKSGSGKTLVTCALLRLLQNRGKRPISFKCGPDFIDPLFHEKVLGVPSTNLDSYFSTESEIREIFAENFTEKKAGCAVIEGVMGFFDGLAGKSLQASTFDIARITKTPVILVLDAEGMSRSIVALVKGFLDYDKEQTGEKESQIKGIFLNKVSKGQSELLKNLIQEECKIPVLGFLSKVSQYVWKSRHLGLFLPREIKDLNRQIEKTAEDLAENLDFPLFEKIMTGESCHCERSVCRRLSPSTFNFHFSTFNLRIAVALDEAFCFYYQENLKLLEKFGAKLEYFSPLHDEKIPSDAQCLLIGGGYPELYASRLEENHSMRESVKSAVKNGISVLAECGGFMYLQEKLVGGGVTKSGGLMPVGDGIMFSGEKKSQFKEFSYEMCGVIPGECRYTGKLVRFGYAEFSKADGIEEKRRLGDVETADGKSGILTAPNAQPFSIKGHEFHYFDSTNNGDSFTAQKPLSSRSWNCMIHTEKMLAGFPHLYYRSNPEIVRWFLDSCRST